MKTSLMGKMEKMMVAVTFAEQNQQEFALKVLSGRPQKKQSQKSRIEKNRQQGQQPRLRM